ncbi:MAG: CHASE3 domain-containing protein [Hyphomicrobium sp.]
MTDQVPAAGTNNAVPQSWGSRIAPLALIIGWAVITAIQSIHSFNLLDESRARARNTHDFLLSLSDFLAAAASAEAGQRGYLITQKESYLEPYTDGLSDVKSSLSRLESLHTGTLNEQSKVAVLKSLWAEKLRGMQSAIDIARSQGEHAARDIVTDDRGKTVMDDIRKTVAELRLAETETRIILLGEVDTNAMQMIKFNLLTTLIGFGALLGFLWQARRAAGRLSAEVSIRQSVEELSRERADQALRVRVMNRELLHRTKNLISVVQAIVRHQGQGTPEIEQYVSGLSDRLVSLAGTLDILVREHWTAVKLEDLIAGQLAHFAEDITRRVIISPGPPVQFTASEAQMIGLALHELGTNAAKYGALSVANGRINIEWTQEPFEDGSTITLRWLESGGPTVEAPLRRGFGSRITEKLVARALDGTAATEYLSKGLNWTLTFHRRRELANDEIGEMSVESRLHEA